MVLLRTVSHYSHYHNIKRTFVKETETQVTIAGEYLKNADEFLFPFFGEDSVISTCFFT